MSVLIDILEAFTGNPTGLATDTASVVAPAVGFIGTVTNFKMWRSLAWLILGIIIMGLGLVLILRAPIEKGVGTVAKAVAL